MANLDLFIAALLGGAGLALVFLLLRVIFGSIFGGGLSFVDKYRIRQKENLLVRADVYLKASDLESSLGFLKNSFFLDLIKNDIKLIDRAHNHNLSVLGKLIGVADRYSTHLANLPLLEDLLISRAQMMKSLIEKKAARNTLKRKRAERARKAPLWAIPEFDAQIAEIREKLSVNKRSVDSQIAKLFSLISNAERGDEVTYH